MLKHDIINSFGKKFNFNSYLEISSVGTGYVYNKIDNKIFTTKSAIYYIPETDVNLKIFKRNDIDIKPNKYEYHHNRIRSEKIKYDIVFVDSWHSYEQSLLDLETALTHISENGIIVVHDCCPYTEDLIGKFRRGGWCGQTYEAFIDFRYNHRELQTFCLYTDYGCGIISMSSRFNIDQNFEEYDKNKTREWNYFNLNKTKLLNLIELDDFIKKQLVYSLQLTENS